MIADHLTGIEKFEADLWRVADNLRANSNLASNEYFMPILGLIFLRHATNRYHAASEAIKEDIAEGRMPDRQLGEADFTSRRALMLPEAARYDRLLEKPKDGSLGASVTAAMQAVEDHFPPLAGQLPKDYQRFEDDVLEEMMRTFDSEALRSASGDVFGQCFGCIWLGHICSFPGVLYPQSRSSHHLDLSALSIPSGVSFSLTAYSNNYISD